MNGAPPQPTAPILPNQGRVIQTGPLRVLCVADVRGMLSIQFHVPTAWAQKAYFE